MEIALRPPIMWMMPIETPQEVCSLTQHHWDLNYYQYHLFLEIPASAQNQFAWHPSGEIHMSMGTSGGSVSIETRAHKDASQDDASTDSSSSSSSDSQ